MMWRGNWDKQFEKKKTERMGECFVVDFRDIMIKLSRLIDAGLWSIPRRRANTESAIMSFAMLPTHSSDIWLSVTCLISTVSMTFTIHGEFNSYACEYYHPQGKGVLQEQQKNAYPKCQYAFSVKPFDYPAIHAI